LIFKLRRYFDYLGKETKASEQLSNLVVDKKKVEAVVKENSEEIRNQIRSENHRIESSRFVNEEEEEDTGEEKRKREDGKREGLTFFVSFREDLVTCPLFSLAVLPFHHSSD